METVDFTPRMPDVEEDFPEGVISLARQMAFDRAKRQLVILTPGRTIQTSKTLPPPEDMAPGNRNILESITQSDSLLYIVAIGMTEFKAFRENPYRAVPFLDFLEGLVRLGHAVVLFEGHSSALARVCQDAGLLLVDEALISFLQPDWLATAEAVMRRPCVLKIKRGDQGFGGAQWLDNPHLRQVSALAKIEIFNRQVVIPAVEEMKTTLERKGKKVTLFPGQPTGNVPIETMFHILFPQPTFVDDLQKGYPSLDAIRAGNACYVGLSFAVEEPILGDNPNAGKVLECIELQLGVNGDIFASPTMMYFMRFNGKFNIFKHRFKQEIEFLRVEDISKYDIQNHFLNAWNFYQLYANQAEAPW